MGTGTTESSERTCTSPGWGVPGVLEPGLGEPRRRQGRAPGLVQQHLSPSRSSELSPRLLSRRPGSPKPQECSPLPRLRPPVSAPPSGSRRTFLRGSGPLHRGTLRIPASRLSLGRPPGAAQAGVWGGLFGALCLSRYRKAVEAAPPEATAEAGESRSRSQRAGSSAPFWGCGVIHPARPRRPALRVQHVSLLAAPAHTCRTRGSNLPKAPLLIPLLSLPRPLPFIYIPSRQLPIRRKREPPAANQEAAAAPSLACSPSATGAWVGDAVLTPALGSRRLTAPSDRPSRAGPALRPRLALVGDGRSLWAGSGEGRLAAGRMPRRLREGRGGGEAPGPGSDREGFLAFQGAGPSHLPVHLPNPAAELLTHPAQQGIYL